MDSACYVDLDNGERELMSFFLLNAFLQSRIDTDNETYNGRNGDEDVNVYMAGLLHSLVDGRFYTDNAERLATSPLDVCKKAEASGNDRDKAIVYRTNADHRLIAFGLFSGWGEHTSLYRRTMTPNAAYMEEAQCFYTWAALFAARMPNRYRGLAITLKKLADGFDTYHEVLVHMSGNYMNLLARLSPGQMARLEHEAHESALPQIVEHALDRMLDAYNRWRASPSAETRQAFMEASGPYSQFNPRFDPNSLLGGTSPN